MNSQYIIRLDDASEYMHIAKWQRMENLLDKYTVKPIVGVIPNNKDPDMVDIYSKDPEFWDKVKTWKSKGWSIALHGYNHTFETDDGGINPVNFRSEFAGVSLMRQKEKIRLGYNKLKEHGIVPKVFFAPAHTFDTNTLIALKEESDIRIISDTIANSTYWYQGIYFVPQQSGHVRNLPFKVVTFCYHPNIMSEDDFLRLKIFLEKYRMRFVNLEEIQFSKRSKGILDKILSSLYFIRRRKH